MGRSNVGIPKDGPMDLNNLQECPRCADSGHFELLGAIFRSLQGELGKRRFWAVGYDTAKREESGDVDRYTIDEGERLLGGGEVRMNLKFSKKCDNCKRVAEVKEV